MCACVCMIKGANDILFDVVFVYMDFRRQSMNIKFLLASSDTVTIDGVKWKM